MSNFSFLKTEWPDLLRDSTTLLRLGVRCATNGALCCLRQPGEALMRLDLKSEE